MTPIPCACGCGRLVGLRCGPHFREDCARRILADVRKLQSLPPQTLATVAAVLQDAGAAKLANAVVGVVPFERTE